MTAAPSPAHLYRLPDGRVLCHAEFGDPAGTPVFYFHGFPGSRLEAQVVHSIGAAGGARILAIDRPGFGGSEFQPGRTLADWPDDVRALAAAYDATPSVSLLAPAARCPVEVTDLRAQVPSGPVRREPFTAEAVHEIHDRMLALVATT